MEWKPIKISDKISGDRILERISGSKNKYISRFGNYLEYVWQYRAMVTTAVEKDFKGRFKYTALGYGWHLLNPLTHILIYYLIFTALLGRDIPNYWLYISSGMFAFSFCSTIITQGAGSIVGNSRMITKIAFAREVLVITKVCIQLITLTISYVILALLVGISGVGLTWNVLWLPVIMIMMATFSAGVAYLFSGIIVYYRDIQNALNIVMGCMLFMVPVIYLAEKRSSPFMDFIWSINPLYYYIETVHNVLWAGIPPDWSFMIIGAVAAAVTLIVGLLVFKKLEHGFAERL